MSTKTKKHMHGLRVHTINPLPKHDSSENIYALTPSPLGASTFSQALSTPPDQQVSLISAKQVEKMVESDNHEAIRLNDGGGGANTVVMMLFSGQTGDPAETRKRAAEFFSVSADAMSDAAVKSGHPTGENRPMRVQIGGDYYLAQEVTSGYTTFSEVSGNPEKLVRIHLDGEWRLIGIDDRGVPADRFTLDPDGTGLEMALKAEGVRMADQMSLTLRMPPIGAKTVVQAENGSDDFDAESASEDVDLAAELNRPLGLVDNEDPGRAFVESLDTTRDVNTVSAAAAAGQNTGIMASGHNPLVTEEAEEAYALQLFDPTA